MKSPFSKTLLFIISLAISFVFFSCSKDISNEQNPDIPDFVSKVNSSVSGFVTDENNLPMPGANVLAGNRSATTNQYGFFEIKNVQVVKTAATVTVTRPGYFKGIKTYIAENNKSAFFRIKLILKTNSGSIIANTGGEVSLNNGLSIYLPANAIVNAASGAAYTGYVNVAAYWINPVGTDLHSIMPGDLRGMSASGSLKILTTYGMAAVELTGSGGELLQIAAGKKAKLTMPIPASISGTAPSSLPMWHFDEAMGLWKEEGTGIKTGNTYIAEVSHFSFWNYDVPNNYVQINCTLTSQNGNPLPFALVRISVVGNQYQASYGFTNVSGFVTGAIPNNAQLLLEISTQTFCNIGTTIYSQNFSTTNADVTLGITVNSPLIAGVSGTVTDCNNFPVANGNVLIQFENQYYQSFPFVNGTFNFAAILCNPTMNARFLAEDHATFQYGVPFDFALSQGQNVIGNLQACGTTSSEFINYTVNGVSYAITSASASFLDNLNLLERHILVLSPITYANLRFSNTNIALNSVQTLLGFRSSQIQDSLHIATTIPVNITEFANVGQYMSGNFSGVLVGGFPPTTNTYNVTCNFR